jgi:hypothetical protein
MVISSLIDRPGETRQRFPGARFGLFVHTREAALFERDAPPPVAPDFSLHPEKRFGVQTKLAILDRAD